MARYVELDGDWARRQPVKLEQVSMYVFALGADKNALQVVCDTMIEGPSGSAVTAEPVFPGVIVVCAEIAKVRSDDPEDRAKGFLVERDVGIFIPVKVEQGGKHWHAAIIPYLFVDNMAGVVGGREIYGFPKELARITIDRAALTFEAESQVLAQYSYTEQARDELVFKVEPIGPVVRGGLPKTVANAMAMVSTTVLTALGTNPQTVLGVPIVPGFDRIPLVFLKQFRDAANATVACHQSLVGAEAPIDTLRSGDILVGAFKITLPRYDSLRIADKLGLLAAVPGNPPQFLTLAGFALDLDCRVSLGKTLWVAP